MLPYRSDRFSFATAIFASCFLATASWGQAFDTTAADYPSQPAGNSLSSKLKFGAATLDLNPRLSLSDSLEQEMERSARLGDASSASFTLDLSGQGANSLFPESLSITARKTDIFGRPQLSIGSIEARDLGDHSKSDYAISADWGAPEDKYTFSYSSSFLGDRTYGGDTTESNDDMLNFTRTLKTGGWLSSFTASIGRGSREEGGTRERSRKFGAAAQFRTTPEGAPHFDITAKVLQDRISRLATGSGDIDTKWELRTDSKILGATSGDDLTAQPSLSIFFSVKGNSPDQEDEDTNAVDFTAGVTGKVHF